MGSQSSSQVLRDAIAGAARICHQEEKDDAHSVRCVGGGGVHNAVDRKPLLSYVAERVD